ncbi:3'(2'),5'-bisphosphate nucleotidase [Roseibium hamelinense]|uniref:3'(2'),5'-bisphosphate nucleotidase CysQ n=1 Tax=Roseibium hamelinense TaxID=150831 RepID=A0A562TIF8_9HYPH|nr:3'(2'),5'-bisphosphate nucleotidase CysQ [Roseibium hamelinense]MTI42786.1 3'(2'),5'-bisphosphate nucleotidase [Roseibium hamelinense]TWI93435.1 3'(2'),5'-bisphosphate nucleotidase [Roseibium hamelinense]
MTATVPPPSSETNPAVAGLVSLALDASREILSVYCKDFSAAGKADGSPVTEADARAERVILAGLKSRFPHISVVAEEACEAGDLPECGQRFFLVDPLDGTKEFISRNGEFTVNIALIVEGVPVFGVVAAPALNAVYWGGVLPSDLGGSGASGAWKALITDDCASDPQPISVRKAPASGLTVLASRSHCSAETEALINQLDVFERVSVGSSLKLCWLAEGRADFYPRLAPTMQWDIAAGDAVLRAAGGETLLAKDLTPFAYHVPQHPEKDDLRNANFLALGDRTMKSRLTPVDGAAAE